MPGALPTFIHTKLSRGFAQRQFVAEVEERHTLWDQPGKLKLLYRLTRGNLGTYLDAIAPAVLIGPSALSGPRLVRCARDDNRRWHLDLIGGGLDVVWAVTG